MITREKSEKNTLKLKVKISAENWQKAINEAYEKNKGKYNVQGFRKGKAPRKVIEQNYGDTVFLDDAFEEAVSKEYGEFLEKNPDIEVAGYPNVSINSMTDQGLEVTLNVELMPEVELGEIALEVKKSKSSVTQKEIESELEKFAESQARFVETDQAANLGDFVVIDFEGSVGGELFEGGSAKDYRLELGSHSFIDNFEDQLIGARPGEEKLVKVQFPENYPASELAGKNSEFKVKIHKVEKKEVPQINDKLISFATDFENVEAYKASIKSKLLQEKEKQAERKFENDLIEAVVAKAKIDLPKGMIESERARLVNDFKAQLAYSNIKLEDYLSYIGKTQEDFENEKLSEAEKSLKTRLVLQKLVKDEKLQISHEEFHEKLHEIADLQNKTCEEAEKSLSENDISYIQNEILLSKIMATLKSKNKN